MAENTVLSARHPTSFRTYFLHCLVISSDTSYQGGVCCCIQMCAECIAEDSVHSPVKAEGCGNVRTSSDSLYSDSEGVSDPAVSDWEFFSLQTSSDPAGLALISWLLLGRLLLWYNDLSVS